MKNLRLDENNINTLLDFTREIFPLTKEVANIICIGTDPIDPCTQVYGVFCDKNEENELVSIMTATYSLVFPHEDGTRVVHISGAYTKEKYRNRGYASILLKAIEKDAKDYFHADYLCCDSTANELYEKNGFITAPIGETRLWKQI